MTEHHIFWEHPAPDKWYTDLPGVGRYTVIKERSFGRQFHWVSTFEDRKTTFTGSTASEVMKQIERAIHAYYLATPRRKP